MRKSRSLRNQVGQSRRERRQSRPPVNQPHGISGAWPQASFVIMGKKFRFVGGHVHIQGALALASLASQAEVKSFLNMIVLPAAFQRISLQHLKKKMSAAASGVHLFPRRHVTGTHGPLLVFAALSHADAAGCGPRKISILFRKEEMGFDFARIVVRARRRFSSSL